MNVINILHVFWNNSFESSVFCEHQWLWRWVTDTLHKVKRHLDPCSVPQAREVPFDSVQTQLLGDRNWMHRLAVQFELVRSAFSGAIPNILMSEGEVQIKSKLPQFTAHECSFCGPKS